MITFSGPLALHSHRAPLRADTPRHARVSAADATRGWDSSELWRRTEEEDTPSDDLTAARCRRAELLWPEGSTTAPQVELIADMAEAVPSKGTRDDT
jgi:hypothetical protein